MIARTLLCVTLLASAAVSAGAQTAGNQKDLQNCEEAVKSGDTERIASAMARITEWRHVFDTGLRGRAEKCLSTGYGEEWVYDWPLGKFSVKSEVEQRGELAAERALARRSEEERLRADRQKAAMQLLAESQARKEANEARIVSESFQACVRLYERDPDSALLNPICIQRFMQFGMP